MAKAQQDAKDFITAKDPKRKRAVLEVADSEDDELLDDTPNARRTRHDEEVARQLQEEYYREVDDSMSGNHDDDGDPQGEDDEDDEDVESLSEPESDPKGKGKAVSRPRPRTTRSAANLIVADSDEESSDSIQYEPPTKRQKKAASTGGNVSSAKGKGKMLAVQDSDFEDDLPRKSLPA